MIYNSLREFQFLMYYILGVFEVDVMPQGESRADRRSYLVQNLKPGNVYQFRVAAKNGYAGISPTSVPSGKI